MAQRVLDITVAYAEGLKNVNYFVNMDVYVVVSIIGGNRSSIKQRTHIDRNSGTHPTWNFPMRFTIDEDNLYLLCEVKCVGSLTNTGIGEVRVPIKELRESASPTNSGKYVHYQVTSPSGKGQGTLTLSYKLSENISESLTVEPANRAAEGTQLLEPYPYSNQYKSQYPAPYEHGLGSGYTNQPAQSLYPNLYPCTYPPEQANEHGLGSGCTKQQPARSLYPNPCPYPPEQANEHGLGSGYTNQQPAQSLYPNPCPYPLEQANEHGLRSGCTTQPAESLYPNPYPCQYPPEQADGSLYNYVTPTTTTAPDYVYSPYPQRPHEVFPPPSSGGYIYPPHPLTASLYPHQSEPRYEYSTHGYMGYGYQ